jgi:hypothetical protein
MSTIQSTIQGIRSDNKLLTVLAWIAILFGSMTPAIILSFFAPATAGEAILPAWLAWTQVAVLVVLSALTWVWDAIRPLRGLALALLAFVVGAFFISPLIMESALLTNWISQTSWGSALVVSKLVGQLVPVILMALTLIGSGLGRKDLFLTMGNHDAIVQPHRLLLSKENVSWKRFGPAFILVFAVITIIIMWLILQPDIHNIPQVIVFLPAITLASAINAAYEEFQFRSVLLARLKPLAKPSQAILMTMVLFSSLHYLTGAPGGIAGLPPTLYIGFVTAKSMLETRGFFWAWLMHFIADFAIFACYATTL